LEAYLNPQQLEKHLLIKRKNIFSPYVFTRYTRQYTTTTESNIALPAKGGMKYWNQNKSGEISSPTNKID